VIEPRFYFGYVGPLVVTLNDGSGDQRRVWQRYVTELRRGTDTIDTTDRAYGLFHVDLGPSWSALGLAERAGYLKDVAAALRANESKIEQTSPHIVFCTRSILARTALRTLQSFIPYMRRVAAANDGLQGLKMLARLAPEVNADLDTLAAAYAYLVDKHAPGLKAK
jgi:hypothetical protein